ncbi:hypothetical protein [Hyalangium versicolor]|uniref:hypothetical protein n=1 Tax=Hyalangium versicolor TaxID=2861190 RepID=UPI001CCD2C28|nr:hypothetical protein [Hyalangium versicolor]
MNNRNDEAWLDTLLQRQLPTGLSDDGFREQLLRRLPPRKRPVRRALILGLTWVLAAVPLLLTTGDTGTLMLVEAGSLLIPCSLGTALLWYLWVSIAQ